MRVTDPTVIEALTCVTANPRTYGLKGRDIRRHGGNVNFTAEQLVRVLNPVGGTSIDRFDLYHRMDQGPTERRAVNQFRGLVRFANDTPAIRDYLNSHGISIGPITWWYREQR